MSVDFTTIKNGIHSWAADVSGCTVIWADQNAPRPAEPYITVRLFTVTREGQDSNGYPDANDEVAVYGNRALVLEIQGYGTGATDKLNVLQSSLQRTMIRAQLYTYLLAYIDDTPIQNISELFQSRIQERAMFEVTFRTHSYVLDIVNNQGVGSIGAVVVEPKYNDPEIYHQDIVIPESSEAGRFIGNFDTLGLRFAILPQCLALGDAPVSFTGDEPLVADPVYSNRAQFDAGAIYFPVFSLGNSVVGKIRGSAQYADGLIDCNSSGYVIVRSNNFRIGNDDPFTYHVVFEGKNTDGLVKCGIMAIPHDDSTWDTMSFELLSIDFDGTIYDYLMIYMEIAGEQKTLLAPREEYARVPDTGVHHFTFTKDDSTLTAYYNGTKLIAEFFDPYVFGTINFGPYFGLGSLPLQSLYAKSKFHAAVYYDRALNDDDIKALVALGGDLGGLKGYDRGDGTMRLENS